MFKSSDFFSYYIAYLIHCVCMHATAFCFSSVETFTMDMCKCLNAYAFLWVCLYSFINGLLYTNILEYFSQL